MSFRLNLELLYLWDLLLVATETGKGILIKSNCYENTDFVDIDVNIYNYGFGMAYGVWR